MKPTWSIACLSLLRTPGPPAAEVSLPQCDIHWDTMVVPPNLKTIRNTLHELSERYDAVALDGITSQFRIAKATYRYEYLWHNLDLETLGPRFSDGSGMRATLERCLVKAAADQLQAQVSGKNILLLSGLNRYGSAEVLSGYSRHLLFGDLLYGCRLGVPIRSFGALVRTAPQLARTVSHMPAQWYWPEARRSRPIMPRFTGYFRWADVIVGGISYFERYAPADLSGKVIFTNIYCQDNVDMFAERDARTIVSLTPNVEGKRVPLPVLEAALNLTDPGLPAADRDDRWLNQLLRLKLKPEIFILEQDITSELAVQLPPSPPAVMEPVAVPEPLTRPMSEAEKFCFVIHPLSFSQAKRIKAVRVASHFVPKRVIEDALARAPHFPVGFIRNVVSKTGARAEGILYGIPMTSRMIMRHPPEFLYRKLLQIAEEASAAGCRIMGLGAFTSVAGDAGLTVSRQAPIAVTSGNSFTAATTLRTLREAAGRCGINLAESNAVVIGSTGSIGSICARLLAGEVRELSCVSPRPERLMGLVEDILQEHPEMVDRVQVYREPEACLGDADVVISTTSQIGAALTVERLKPGCVVCDVARPPDIREADARSRPDILVCESGEIMLPEGAELTYDIGLPEGLVYACLAETILLTLEGKFESFTVGRQLSKEKVQEIDRISHRHGLELAPIRSFGEIVPDEHFAALRETNARRFSPAASQSG